MARKSLIQIPSEIRRKATIERYNKIYAYYLRELNLGTKAYDAIVMTANAFNVTIATVYKVKREKEKEKGASNESDNAANSR